MVRKVKKGIMVSGKSVMEVSEEAMGGKEGSTYSS